MDKWLLAFAAVFLFLNAGGCSSDKTFVPDYDFQPKLSDMLTPAELNALTIHARNFVSKSEKLPLKPAQKKLIKAVRPDVKIKYYGKKYGQIRMTWRVATNALLELYGTGNMLEEDFPWRLRFSASDGTHPVPDEIRHNVERIR